MTGAITTVLVSREHDVVLARQRARQVASLLGLDGQDQVRVATAVSELARNAFQYAGGGKIEYLIAAEPESLLVVRISDRGPGIGNLDDVLEGRYESKTGMGLGILGARRLMDRFEIESTANAGTTVVVPKRLGDAAPSNAAIVRIADALAREVGEGPIGELQVQNQELMRALDELHARQQELAQLNRELEETNRGVVAL
jgi:anti-sigma regulatory factor (Ser/Thr protein kinase)